MAKRLTALSVENAKPGTSRREIPDGGSGLYLIVQPSGHKSYAVRYRLPGSPKTHKFTLDGWPSLADARVQAAAALAEVKKGNDPGKDKRRAKEKRGIAAANTFEAVAQIYLDSAPVKKLRRPDQKRDILERLVFPIIGSMPIGDVKRSTVTALLDRIDARNGPVSADRAFTEMALVLKFHAKRDDDYVYPLVSGMRASSSKQRDRTLTDKEIKAVWDTGDPFAQFLLLTGCRRTEAAGMQWSEVPEGTDWILPASRNKGGVDLVRPLSMRAMALLATLPRRGQYVFGVDKPFKSFTRAAEIVREASGTKGWVFHDLRRTSRTLMSRAGASSENSERCLGHVIGTTVTRTYDRWEYRREKRDVYEALAGLLDRIVNPPSDNVVALRA
jgi:integrase